jgi:hypothetical protein
MSFRRSTCQICLAAAILAVSGLLVCNAQTGGKERTRPIEFSRPRSDQGTTNLQQLMGKPDSLQQLEDESYRPLQPFAPQSSLDGVVAPRTRPPATPAIQNKRVKELLERRKNWVFSSPEDLLMSPTVEDILKKPVLGLDGKEQKELPAYERYFERLTSKRSAPEVNSLVPYKSDELFGSPSRANPREELAVQEDANLPSGVKERAEALKKLLDAGGGDRLFGQGAAHGTIADTFGLANNTPSKEQMQDHKKFLDDYRSVLDRTWHPPTIPLPGDAPAFLADTAAPAMRPSPGLPSVARPALSHETEAQPDVRNIVLGPPELPNVSAQALGQTRPMPVLPAVETKRVTPITPSFNAPKRAFH